MTVSRWMDAHGRSAAAVLLGVCAYTAAGCWQPLHECDGYQDCQRLLGGDWRYVCKDGGCVRSELVDNEGVSCSLPTREDEIAALRDPAAFLVGTLLPVGEPFTSLGEPMQAGAELAVREFNGIGGIGGRKFGLLRCDTAGDIAKGTAGARFLAEDVGVKGIVGPAFSGVALGVAQSVTIRNEVLVISPSATTPAVSGLDDDGLVWRTAPSDAIQGRAMAEFLRGLGGLQRVLVVYKNDPYGGGLRDVLVEQLGSDASFELESYAYADPGKPAEGFDASAVAVDIAAEHDPQVVVLIGTSEVYEATTASGDAQNGILFQTEKQWASASYRALHAAPILWLVSEGGKNEKFVELLKTLPAGEGNPPDLASRVVGTTPGSIGAKNRDSFAQRFIDAFEQYDKVELYAPESYDAMYLIAFAHATLPAGTRDYTGLDLAAGMRRVVGGDSEIDIGPSRITEVMRRLQASAKVLIAGASGVLSLDENGDPPGAIDFYWVTSDGAGGYAYETHLYLRPSPTNPQSYEADPSAVPETARLPAPYEASGT